MWQKVINLLIVAWLLLWAVVGATIFEPKTVFECSDVVILDKYRDHEGDLIVAFRRGDEVIFMPANGDEYYLHEVGEAVTACRDRGNWTRIKTDWYFLR